MKEKTILLIKVTPNAQKDEIIGFDAEILKIRIKAAPEKGKANKALIAFLAKKLGCPKSQIQIIQGVSSRNKKVLIEGINTKAVQSRLKPQHS